jgi:hypothetical protein
MVYGGKVLLDPFRRAAGEGVDDGGNVDGSVFLSLVEPPDAVDVCVGDSPQADNR